jgi:drug/metabolite transporter (DMT)-like permease
MSAPLSPSLSSSTAARAIGLMMMAVFLFAVMDAMIKWQGAVYPVLQIVFFRSAFGLLISIGPVLHDGRRLLATKRPWLHLLRALLGFGALFCFFEAFVRMPFADVYAISFASPLFITALSVPFLGEKVGWRRWTAVGVGLVGVLLMVRPGAGVFEVAAMIALAGTLCYAVAMILVRLLARTDSNIAIVFYFGIMATFLSGLTLPFVWVTPAWEDLLWLALIGIIGGAAQLILTQSFRMAPVSLLTPFEYVAMLWAVLFGWLFWRELPDPYFYAGAPLVVASGLYILHRETRHKP